jgi:signal peptidase I
MAAFFTFATVLVMLVVASYTAWRPSGGPAWATAVLLAASLGLIAVELFQTYIAWPIGGDGEAAALAADRRAGDKRHWLGAAALTALAVLLGAIVATSYRTIVIHGDGMVPTVSNGDRLLCRLGVDRRLLTPERLILFSCSPNSKGTTVGDHKLGRIIAVPGDTIEIRDRVYFVNGKSVRRVGPRGSELPALTIPQVVPKGLESSDAKPHAPAYVPPDCYFIVQDSVERGLDSRMLSWVELENIKGTDLFAFDRGFLPRRVE